MFLYEREFDLFTLCSTRNYVCAQAYTQSFHLLRFRAMMTTCELQHNMQCLTKTCKTNAEESQV